MIVEYASRRDHTAHGRYEGEIRLNHETGDLWIQSVDPKQKPDRLVLLFHVEHPGGREAVQPFDLMVINAHRGDLDLLRNRGVVHEVWRQNLFGDLPTKDGSP